MEEKKKTKSTLRDSKTMLRFLDRHFQHVGKTGVNLVKYRQREILELLNMAEEALKETKTLLETDPPINIVGDLHGQFNDLLLMLCTLGPPPKTRYIFLGDYVDRGKQGVECIVLLLAYMVKYPNSVHLLRGNHECRKINEIYGFKMECERRFKTSRIWRRFQSVFNYLPCSGLIGGKVLCMHGGLSPMLTSLKQLRVLPRPTEAEDEGHIINDLLWADPEVGILGWMDSLRGTSKVFGPDVVEEYCKQLGIECIVRAHQCCKDGYRFFAKRKLVTLFSAPNYCGDDPNCGAVMEISSRFICKFRIFSPTVEPPREVSYRRESVKT